MNAQATTKTRPTYRMVRVSGETYDRNELPELRKGDTVFLARIWDQDFPHAGKVWTEASHTPFQTNQSHEDREHGWCGNTSGTDVTAIGRATVVKVVGEISDTYDGISGKEIPAYLSLQVRLDDDAPDTFEVRMISSGFVDEDDYPIKEERVVRIFSDEMILAHPEEYPAQVVASAVATANQR
jgi:hypothetical protein